MCRHVDEGERAFFAWVSMESFTADEVQAQLRARRGRCTRRTRRLVVTAGEGHVTTTVTRHAVLGARTALRERTSPGRCRALDAADATVGRSIGIVLDGLSDPSHVRLDSPHSDTCLPHVVEAAGRCQRGPLKLIAERPAERPRRLGCGRVMRLAQTAAGAADGVYPWIHPGWCEDPYPAVSVRWHQ